MSTTAQTDTTVEVSAAEDAALPEGWLAALLPEACDINPPKPPADALPTDAPVTFVPMPAVDAEDGAITKPQERPFSKVRKGFTAFQEGDVIFAKITPCMENGKAAIARSLLNGLGFGSTEFHVLRSNGAALPEFVHHFIRRESFRKAAEAEMTGSVGQKRVPVDFLERVELPLPPLAEQKRIVEKVEVLFTEVNAARARLARVPKILKSFRQAVLGAACSGRLTEDWRSKHFSSSGSSDALSKLLEHESPNSRDDEYGQLPETWYTSTLEALCDTVVDCPHSTPKWATSGVICIRTSNFLAGTLDLSDVRYVSETTYAERTQRLVPKAGDVVYSREGGILGLACMIAPGTRLCLGQRMMLMRTNKRTCLPAFLMHVLNSPPTVERVSELTGGSASPHLNVGEIKKFPVPVPPLPEQDEIVRCVEALFKLADTIEKRVRAATKRSERLTQAILAKAFRGDLVPTEAEVARREGRDYEPAASLLARIRSAGDASGIRRPLGGKRGCPANLRGHLIP